MAKTKKGKRRGGDDVVIISREDWKGKKKFPTAPGGKYRFRFNKKSSIKPNAAGDGSVLNLIITLSAMHNGKKTKHKGINCFDNIAPHVGWKIAQVLKAMGVKKPPKKMTLKELLALIKKFDKEIRAVIGVRRFRGKPQNPVLQYLPLKSSKDEDDDDIEDDEDEDDEDEDDDDDEDSDDDDSEDDDDDDSDDDDDEDEDEDEDDEDEDDEDEDDEDEDDEDEDDDEDDEDERPRRKSKSKSKKRKTRR